MKKYKLGEICDIITGSTPLTKSPEYYGGDFLRACPADLDQGNVVNITTKTLSKKGVKEGKIRIVPQGSVMVCCIGTVGKCSIAGQEMATNQQINSFAPKKGVLDSKYLLYSIRFHENIFKTRATSTTVPILNKSQCAEIQIPLPPLTTQRAIAERLDQIQELIDLKKQALTKTDELAKAIFLEIFGDPMTNEKGWEVKELGEVLSIKHGFAFKSEFFSNEGEYVLLTPGNFYEEGGYKDRGEKQKYYNGIFPEEYLLKKGNLLVAMTEQSPGLLGSPIIIPKSNTYLHNQRLGLLEFNSKEVNTEFLFYVFNFPKIRKTIQSSATGTKVQHTSPTKIESITVSIPPLPLQQQFAEIITEIESQKTDHKQALVKLEELYQAEMQRSFSL